MVKRWLERVQKCSARCGRPLLPRELVVKIRHGLIAGDGSFQRLPGQDEVWGVVHRACLGTHIFDAEMAFEALDDTTTKEMTSGGTVGHCLNCEGSLFSGSAVIQFMAGTVRSDGTVGRGSVERLVHQRCFAVGMSAKGWARMREAMTQRSSRKAR